MDVSALGSLAQKLRGGRLPERVPGGEQLQRLDSVGFAAGVRSSQQRDGRREVHGTALEVPEILELELCDAQTHVRAARA